MTDWDIIEVDGMTYRYSLISTGHSSARFGSCSVCAKHASEVFIQFEERKYSLSANKTEREMFDFLNDPEVYKGGKRGWTTNRCFNLVGHEECLRGQRRNVLVEVVT